MVGCGKVMTESTADILRRAHFFGWCDGGGSPGQQRNHRCGCAVEGMERNTLAWCVYRKDYSAQKTARGDTQRMTNRAQIPQIVPLGCVTKNVSWHALCGLVGFSSPSRANWRLPSWSTLYDVAREELKWRLRWELVAGYSGEIQR